MRKHLTIFRILYLLFLLFALIHFVLGLFIYLNSIGLIVHLFIGISGKNSKGILPSLLSLDHRYIWFPIATYLIFFTVAALTILFMKFIENKRS